MRITPIRQKGKVKLSEYFKKINEGDTVAIIHERGFAIAFPKRIIGNTGKVIGSRGSYRLVQISDGNKIKTFIIHPIHLKKLDVISSKEKIKKTNKE